MKWSNVILIISILANMALCAFLLSDCRGEKPLQTIVYVEKHDTIEIEKERIVEKTKTRTINHIDTFYAIEKDTVWLHDLPIEHKVYEDTIKTDTTSTRIKIDYSGFNANINSIYLQHNYFSTKETITKPHKRIGIAWAIGPSIGYSFYGDVTKGTFGHGVTIGISGTIGIGGIIK